MFGSNESSQRQTNKVKILAAYGLPRGRYLTFKSRYKNELGKIFSTIIRTKHGVSRTIWNRTASNPLIGPNNTMFCPYNSGENFF